MRRTRTRRWRCSVALAAAALAAATTLAAPAAESAPSAGAVATAATVAPPLPCIQPLTPTVVLDTAKAPGVLGAGKPRTVSLGSAVPTDAAAVVLQVRTKSLKIGQLKAVALGSSAPPTTIATVGAKWVSTTALVAAPSQQLSVTFAGPAYSNAQVTIEVVGVATAQDCFNGLPFHAAVDTATGAGLPAAGALVAGSSTPISLQGPNQVPATTGSALASVAIAAGATAATTVTLKDDSDPANVLATWTVTAKDDLRFLEVLPPSDTHRYTLVTTGGPASVSITPQGWFSGPDGYARSSHVVLDSANGIGAQKGNLVLGRVMTFKVPEDIPNAAAVVVSLTAASPNADSAISVWTGGAPRPLTTTLNLSTKKPFRQQVLLSPGSGNSFSVRANTGSTALKAAVVGWVPYPAAVNTPIEGITHITTETQVSSVESDPASGDTTITYAGDHVDVGDVLVSGVTDLLPDGIIGVVTDVNALQPASAPAGTATLTAGPAPSEVTMQPATLLDALPAADMDSANLDVTTADPAPEVLDPLGPDNPGDIDPSTSDPGTPTAQRRALQRAQTTQAAQAAQAGGGVPSGTKFCTGSAGGLKASTSLKLSGGVNLTGSWRPGSTKVSFGFDGGLSGSASLSADAGITCSGSANIPGPTLPTITFTVGPVPVVVRPEVSLKVSASAGFGGSFQVRTGFDVSTSAGINYNNGAWSPYFNTRASLPTSTDARLGGNANVSFAPRLTLKLYGVAGPYIELAASAQANVNLLRQPWWTASADLSANAGLVLDLWFLHASFNASRSLYHGSWSAPTAYPGPTITTTGLPNGRVNTGYGATLTTSGGTAPMSWSLVGGALPSGLRLNSNGTITGTPTTVQTSSFTVRATGANGYRSVQDKTFQIGIGSQPVDNCPNGDNSGSLYDGSCGPQPDYCPGGDFTGNPYDGSCGSPPGSGGGGATISLSKGAPGPVGYWYNVALSGFTPGQVVTLTCRDSVDPGGFWTQNFTINGAGQAADTTLCYSTDHPDHWVTSNTGVQSNHVTW